MTRNLLKSARYFVAILFVSLGLNGWGQTVQTFTSSGSWTVPCGVTSVTIQVWGGGGGGGGGSSSSGSGGSGGGGGALVTNTFSVSSGGVINFTIGSAGTAGAAAGGTGGNGGQSSVSGPLINMTAAGGTGGAGNSGAAGIAGANGTSSGGTITNGTNGIQGGASGGNGGNGGGTTNTFGAGSLNGPGMSGSIPGGAGGGGERDGGTSRPGGAGASGRISFTYTSSITLPNAGSDINLCGVTNLSGNTPDVGWTGTWTLVSGSASISSPNSPNTGISGIASGACATFRWTFSQVGCPSVSDDVTICVPLVCNENPCGAIPLTVGTSCTYSAFSNVNASISQVYPEPGCGSFSQSLSEDVWFSAVIPSTGILTIQAVDAPGGISFYPGITIYSGTSCSNLSHSGCAFTTSTITPATNTVTGTPGETVYIRVWDYLDNTGSFNICASTHSNTISNIVTGNTTISCGSSLSFMDPGGNGNYQNNTSAFYTLCPTTAGQFVSVNFSSFSLGSGDQLIVFNGSGNSPSIIGQYTGTTIPSTITSSASDGCLSFAFHSNNSIVSTGWNATVTCSSTAGTNTTICSSTNCSGGCGYWLCASGGYPTENAGTAGVNDITNQTSGCFGSAGEISSKWFYFQADQTGTITLQFDGPSGQDYDFAIYGPTTDYSIPCPTSGISPIRCSYSAASNPVGLGNGATDYFEGAEGDGWVAPLQVQAGETYAMILNIFQNGNPQPTINMTIGGTGNLDCTPIVPLPITLLSFEGVHNQSSNLLYWITSSEINNDFFTLERSFNGHDWTIVGNVQGAGTSNDSRYYSLRDFNFFSPISYYRLIQTDFDGNKSTSDVISISTLNIEDDNIFGELYPNPSSSYFSFNYNGNKFNQPVIIKIYSEIGSLVDELIYSDMHKNKPTLVRTTNLVNGVYYVELIQDGYSEKRKLTVIR